MTDTSNAELIARLRSWASCQDARDEDTLLTEAADALAALEKDKTDLIISEQFQMRRADALAMARRDALEECAAKLDSMSDVSYQYATLAKAAIRSLIDKEK
jgi:hypothetical protein